ncbi:MAG TPA: MFS transporter [Gaiellaceae bacterium]
MQGWVGAATRTLALPRPREEGYPRRVLLVLLAVLAVDYADRSAIGALAPELKKQFHTGNLAIGLLAAAFSVVATLGSVPAGILADRARRTLLLAVSLALWSGASVFTGAAVSLEMLLAARVILGVVTATGRPVIASLTGDLFSPGDRGRVLGAIDSGELLGTGLGFLVAGLVARWLSWRWVFWLLALAGLCLVASALRLPEPARTAADDAKDEIAHDELGRQVEDEGAEPDERIVVGREQRDRSFLSAVALFVHIRTFVLVLVSDSIGYFFFAGLRTFVVVFMVEQYGVRQANADLALLLGGTGAVVGVFVGGRVGDALLRRGRITARLEVACAGYLIATAALFPAVLLTSLWPSIPLLFAGAFGLALPMPSLDAVRLDVVHPDLWGRAESTRNVFKIAAEAIAPVVFGLLADRIAGGGRAGVQAAFLITLPTVALSGLLLLVVRRCYAPDVAAVNASLSDD